MITFWLTVGIILTALELLLPGAVAVFVGLGALTTVGFIYLGIVETWTMAFATWFLSSILYLLVLRSFAMKLFPGDESIDNTDEEADASGTIVEVSVDILAAKPGRIRYLDSTWDAYSASDIRAGDNAILISRNGNGWNVKPID